MENENNFYLKALKSKPLKEIKMATSERKNAFLEQNKKCAKCNKELRSYFYKYIKDPVTKKFKVVCSNCAIKTAQRRG